MLIQWYRIHLYDFVATSRILSFKALKSILLIEVIISFLDIRFKEWTILNNLIEKNLFGIRWKLVTVLRIFSIIRNFVIIFATLIELMAEFRFEKQTSSLVSSRRANSLFLIVLALVKLIILNVFNIR